MMNPLNLDADMDVQATGGVSTADFVVPAGADLAMYLNLGPSELNNEAATAEVEGLFDELTYETTGSTVEDMAFVDGYGCALTLSDEILCFRAASGGSQSLMGQNRSDVWGMYSQGHAPLSVEPEVGQSWSSIHAGRGGDSDWFCAVDDADAIACWGNLGMGSMGQMYFATVSDDAREPVVQLKLGNDFACALFDSGRVGCFGYDTYAAGSDAGWGSGFNASLRNIDIPSNVTVAEIIVGGSDVCARGTQLEFMCWGSSEGSSEPEFDTMFNTLNDASPVEVMIAPMSSTNSIGKCYLFGNGSVGCHHINADSAVRGTTSPVGNDNDMSFVDLPTGTTATDLWMAPHHWGQDTIVCADLDDGTFACWGSTYNSTMRSWSAANTPYLLDVPTGAERVFVDASYDGAGPVLALDGGDHRLYQQMLVDHWSPTNRSSGSSPTGPGGAPPSSDSGWVGVDFAGNNIIGRPSTLGIHNLTLWINGTDGDDDAHEFSIEVVEPFANVDPIYEYEIGRRVSQKLNVDELCNPTAGMNCEFFFWPAAPDGITISTWDWPDNPWMMNGPVDYEPSVSGTAKGNKINTDYTIVVQQWANTYGHHASPWDSGPNSGEMELNTMTVNVTLRPSTQSAGSVKVASGFPFTTTADNLLPFMATSESFEIEGDVPNFNLDIVTESRSFNEVSTFQSAVCASGDDGMSCMGSPWVFSDPYSYNLVRTTVSQGFGGDPLTSPIDAAMLVNASLSNTTTDGPFACWTNFDQQLECAASEQAMGNSFRLITDDQSLQMNGGAMAPTALWGGAEVTMSVVDLGYEGVICSVLATNGTLVCRVDTNNPVLNTPQGSSQVWVEEANNISSMAKFTDMLCIIHGNGGMGEGLHCASSYTGEYAYLADDQGASVSGEFQAFLQPNRSGSSAPDMLTGLVALAGNACAQVHNDSLYCFDNRFGSLDASRNYGGHLTPMFTVPGLDAIVEAGNTQYYNQVTCVLDEDGDVFCMEYTTPHGMNNMGMPDWWSDLGTLVYNETVADQWSPSDEYSFKVYEMDVGGNAVDIAQSYENLFIVLDDGSLVALGARPSQMAIGQGEFTFGIDSEPVYVSTAATEVNPTLIGLTISGTPPAGYGTSPELRIWGNSSYGSQTEPGTQSTWDGESDNVYPFVLDYVHAVAFEHEYLEVLTTGDVSIPVDVTCTWCTTFNFQPELPGDWSFDAVSGTISGTPGTAGAAVQYTVTASASNGSDSTDVRIRVVDQYTVPSLAGMTVASSSQAAPVELVANSAMMPIQLVDAESVTSMWTVSPNLPVGVHLNEETGEIFGTPAFLGNGPVAYVINASSPMGTSAEVTIWLSVVDQLTSLPDFDQDGTPDETDADDDNDGVDDVDDAFPFDANEWSDLDEDGIGDNADTDADGDGVPADEDQDDLDPSIGAETAPDMDGDGIPDDQDDDIDGDGRLNAEDAFPRDPTEWVDLDGDGTGDNSDGDIDGDGVLNDADAFPMDSNEWADLDQDGTGDNSDTDADGDGVLNDVDEDDMDGSVGMVDDGGNNNTSNGTETNTTVDDLDGDGTPDANDDDIDGDGIPNSDDAFPEDSGEDTDLDGDGVGDNADDDADGDGIPASEDQDDFDATVGRLSTASGSDNEGGFSFVWIMLLLLLVPLVLFFVRSNEEDEEAMAYEQKDVVSLNTEEE